MQLNADSIIYYSDTSILQAFGHVKLKTGKDTFYGDSVYYSTDLKLGIGFNAETNQEKGRIIGKEIYRDSGNVIYVKGGIFTSCDKNPPHYVFASKKMKLIKDNMAIVEPLVLKIHSVPVFAVPFWFFPVKTGRKSGLLTPHIGSNSYDGKYIRNIAYYLVLNNYADITFSMDLIEKRGARFGISGVYNLYKHFNGTITYTRAEEFWPRAMRWSISGHHEQKFPHNTRFTSSFEYYSDYNYENDYAQTTVDWLKKEMHSYASLSKTTKFFTSSASIDDRINPVTKERITDMPLVNLYFSSFNIWKLRAGYSASFLYKRTKDSVSTTSRWGQRNAASFSYAFSLFRYIRFTDILSSNWSVIDRDTSQKRFAFIKGVSFSQGIKTTLYGYSVFKIGPIEKIRHTFNPSVSLSYTPEIENPVCDFNYGSIPVRNESVNFQAGNRFDAKIGEKAVHLFDLNLSSSCNLLKEENKFSDININGSLSQSLPISIRGNAIYAVYDKKISSYGGNIGFHSIIRLFKNDFSEQDSSTSQNKISFSINYNFNRQADNSNQNLQINANYNLTKTISGSAAAAYDLAKGQFLSRSFSLVKDLHCWEAMFSYTKYGTKWDYNFRIWIKKLPDIKVEKGLVQSILPESAR